jgi:hypothetical protein
MISESAPFQFSIGSNTVAVHFDASPEPSTVVHCGAADFFFSADETFCGVTLGGLSTDATRRVGSSFA